MMNLTVRNMKLAHMQAPVPMICDDQGRPLPNQRRVIIDAGVDDCVIVTVEFVAGEEVKIIESV